ncbi:MAG: hypothetical protein R3A52_05300 [Polyangiales bacterium]
MRNDFLRAAIVLAASTTLGCSGDGAAPTDPGSGMSYPLEIARIIEGNCVSCHAATPRYGAPMSLARWDDTRRPAASAPARQVWNLMGERVHDPVRPMPPARLSEADLATFDRWIAAGAPGCTGSDCGSMTGPDAVESPADRLPCAPSERRAFLAHGPTVADRYTVPGAAGNLNRCFAFQSPFRGAQQATAFAARVDNARVLHHLILFSTASRPAAGEVFDCDGNMPRDARFIAGWAPGNQGTVLPSDVGLELPGEGEWFILQTHYWNNTLDAADDASGIEMCTTDAPRPHTAAVHWLGTLNIAIPPRSTGYETEGWCTPAATEPIHVLGSTAHMHRNGTALRSEVHRGGSAARMDTLTDVTDYSFDAQVSRPSDLVIMPGDRLRTVCRYDNVSSATVFFGERTEDEMCFNFVLAWPAGALANAAGQSTRRCIDRAR